MWVKVCGLCSVENAVAVAEAGVDAIGLNFYSKSKRYVDPQTAQAIVQALPPEVEPVGLFVNHPPQEVKEIATLVGLKTIQLHGDETPEQVKLLNSYRLIRAFRLDEENVADLPEMISNYTALGIELFAALIDAKVTGSYGGTGHQIPWDQFNQLEASIDEQTNVILAGGLTPENVTTAVQVVTPWGVDTASGVESAPGIKDVDLVRKFVNRSKAVSN